MTIRDIRHPAPTTWEWFDEVAEHRLHEGRAYCRFAQGDEWSLVGESRIPASVGDLLRHLTALACPLTKET